jgi:glycosyltransferase involved in cell wall biosynthesis
VPVLASDLRRLRFFVQPEETGLLVAPGDIGAWAEAIRTAAGSPVARARWGRNARATAEARFSWPGIAASFEGLFREARVRASEPEPVRRSAG